MTAQPTYSPAPPIAAPAPAPRRRTGRALGVAVAVLLVLGGLGAAALYLFGTRTIQPEPVQDEIVRITRTAVQVAPADVRCPEGIAAQAGGTFTCTATVDGQPVTYWVHQDDGKGDLTITYDRLLRVDALERAVAAKASSDLETAVTVDCGSRTVLRNTPGQKVGCTAT